MPVEDLARALIRLDNEYVRQEVGRGELASFEELGFELSDEERELLIAATRGVARDEQLPVTRLGEQPRPAEPGEGGPGRGWG